MAELAMLADIQRTVYPEEVTRQLHFTASDGQIQIMIWLNYDWITHVDLIWLLNDFIWFYMILILWSNLFPYGDGQFQKFYDSTLIAKIDTC